MIRSFDPQLRPFFGVRKMIAEDFKMICAKWKASEKTEEGKRLGLAFGPKKSGQNVSDMHKACINHRKSVCVFVYLNICIFDSLPTRHGLPLTGPNGAAQKEELVVSRLAIVSRLSGQLSASDFY